MTDTFKDSRLSGASSLHGDIEALLKVRPEQRQGFVHDRLMSAIDAICEEHKGKGHGQTFTKYQMLVIKDVAYHVVYLLDPLNKEKKGFWPKLRQQWGEALPITKVAWVAGSLAFCVPALSGTIQSVRGAVSIVKSFHLKIGDETAPKSPDAAIVPSKSETPTH